MFLLTFAKAEARTLIFVNVRHQPSGVIVIMPVPLWKGDLSPMLERKPQWPLQQHVWDQEELMNHVMARLGIEPLVAARSGQGLDMIEARNRCVACKAALDRAATRGEVLLGTLRARAGERFTPEWPWTSRTCEPSFS